MTVDLGKQEAVVHEHSVAMVEMEMEGDEMETYSESFSMWVLQLEDWEENMKQGHDCIKE